MATMASKSFWKWDKKTSVARASASAPSSCARTKPGPVVKSASGSARDAIFGNFIAYLWAVITHVMGWLAPASEEWSGLAGHVRVSITSSIPHKVVKVATAALFRSRQAGIITS